MCKPAFIQWQPSVNRHTNTHRHARPKRSELHLLTIFQAVYKVSRKINGVLTETKDLGGGAAELFFSCFVSTLSSPADVTVKVDELLVPRVCRDEIGGAPAEVKVMWNHTWDLRTPLSISFSGSFALSRCARLRFLIRKGLTVQKPWQITTGWWLPLSPRRENSSLYCRECGCKQVLQTDSGGCLPTAGTDLRADSPHTKIKEQMLSIIKGLGVIHCTHHTFSLFNYNPVQFASLC